MLSEHCCSALSLGKLLSLRVRLSIRARMVLASGCGAGGTTTSATPQVSALAIATITALNRARLVTLATSSPGASIQFMLDGSKHSDASAIDAASFLVASNVAVDAVAIALEIQQLALAVWRLF